jgi:glycosyltransferase involved in cell wall biosynthesis
LNTPIVSVCIATYNQDCYIKNCIVSVLAQMPDVSIEILIGDDGSGSETPRIVENLMAIYPGVIRYYKHEKNLGPSANYQFLIKEARGCYLAHLDGDDFWLPGKLADQLKWLESHPASVACYTNAIVVNDAQELRGLFSSPMTDPIDFQFLLRKGNFLNHSSMLYRATQKKVILDFDGPFIDYRIHLNFARIGELGFINAAAVVYRLGSLHSMVRTTPGLVLNLYFDALVSVLTDPLISKSLRCQALRNFWRAIAVECLVKCQIVWGIGWAQKIRLFHPGGIVGIFIVGSFFSLGTLFSLVFKRGIGRMFGVNNLKVLHEC